LGTAAADQIEVERSLPAVITTGFGGRRLAPRLASGKRAGWKAVFTKRTHWGIKLHPIESD
jgi:hypothetical protein